MVGLKKLASISKESNEISESKEKQRIRIINEEYEKFFHDIVMDIELKLKEAAFHGKHSLFVADFFIYNYGRIEEFHPNFTKPIDAKVVGNMYTSWGNTVTEKDVIETMSGNLRRIYDFLKTEGLNPRIDYNDNNSNSVFEINIEW